MGPLAEVATISVATEPGQHVRGPAVERKWRDCMAQQPHIILRNDAVDERTRADIPERAHGKQHELLGEVEVDISVGRTIDVIQGLANPHLIRQ